MVFSSKFTNHDVLFWNFESFLRAKNFELIDDFGRYLRICPLKTLNFNSLVRLRMFCFSSKNTIPLVTFRMFLFFSSRHNSVSQFRRYIRCPRLKPIFLSDGNTKFFLKWPEHTKPFLSRVNNTVVTQPHLVAGKLITVPLSCERFCSTIFGATLIILPAHCNSVLMSCDVIRCACPPGLLLLSEDLSDVWPRAFARGVSL